MLCSVLGPLLLEMHCQPHLQPLKPVSVWTGIVLRNGPSYCNDDTWHPLLGIAREERLSSAPSALLVRGNVLLLALPPTAAVNWSALSPVRGRCVSAGVKLFKIGTIKRGCAQCFLLFPDCFSLSYLSLGFF